MTRMDITLQERHVAELGALLHHDDGHEAAAYVLFGKSEVGRDPWDQRARCRLTSHLVRPVPADELISTARSM